MTGESVHPGDILAGRYRVERVLGRGGMGVVVAATDLARREPCAVKLLTEAALSHPTAVERFVREARAIAGLRSEHVVRLLDVGELPSGAPYMAMEHLEGADLGSVVKRRGALPAHEAARYVMQVCSALDEAHRAGIVHRDLKPANLFLTRGADGSASIKILDFGISKALVTDAEDPRLTLSNAVLGSPSYMSPEQIRSARSVDARSDIWSLGVVLYQLVTGQLPFRGADASQVIGLVVREDPAPPSKLRPGLPLALDGTILRCLEKDPARRFQSAADLSAALAPFATTARVRSQPPPSGVAASAPPRARKSGLVALVVAGAAIVAIAVYAMILR